MVKNDFWPDLVGSLEGVGDWIGDALGYVSDALLGTNFINNKKNIEFQQETNAQNEALMREAWSREDNAVQRRVADLKAAGLSPTLAAGSAASASGPISLKSPQSSLSYRNDLLSVLAASKSLEKVDLENENLRKQGKLLDLNAKYYGMPEWMIAGNQIFGADAFLAKLKELGGKTFDALSNLPFYFGSGSGGKSDDPSISDILEDAEKKLGREALNESVKRGLSNAGIDVEPLTSLFDPTSYGKPLNDAVKKFANQMISDNMVKGDVISGLAHSLATIYKVSFDDVISIFRTYLPGYNLIVK